MGNVFVCRNCGYVHRLDDWYIKLLARHGLVSKHKCPVCGRTDGFVKVISTRGVQDVYAWMRRHGRDPDTWKALLAAMNREKFSRKGKIKKKYLEAIEELKMLDSKKKALAAKAIGLIPKELRED